MKQKKIWRYYCDHCKKSGCNGFHIKTHEKHCCKNPSRECRMCRTAQRDYKAICALAEKSAGISWIEAVSRQVDGCPSCILATIIQNKDPMDIDTGVWSWDYKEARKIWWETHNDVEADY